MKALIKIIITAVALMTSVQVSASKYFDGYQALSMCQSTSLDMSAGCSMFIIGVTESLRMAGYQGDKYCLKGDINNAKLKQDFVIFLQENQNSLQYSATSLLYANVRQNWPCPVMAPNKE